MLVMSGLRKDLCRRRPTIIDSAVEPVSHSAHTDQELWLARLGLDLLAQVCDVGIHNPVGDEGFSAPHFVQQPLAAQRVVTVADESSQQLKFKWGHLYGRP